MDTLADLLVEDLARGSSTLRSKLPGLLDKCGLVMKVNDEYHIQTEESSAWNDDFLSHRAALANEAHRIETERDDRIRKKFSELVRKSSINHGDSKVPRDIFPVFDSRLPSDADQKICVWIRDGWNIDENSVRADARQAGNQSPTVFVFVPKRSADDLRHYLIDFKAASATLDKRGFPTTPEGIEARAAMETTKQTADSKIHELLNDAFAGARVFQGGGNEILGNSIQDAVLDAVANGLQRLFPQFFIADLPLMVKVYEKAQKGALNALQAVGFDDEPAKHPVCKAILGCIAGGKKGADIRSHFESAPYGWSRDAVDGGLQVLLVAGLIRAQDERGQTIPPTELERKNIGKTIFKVESATVSTPQRIQIRKLFQRMGFEVKQGEESVYVPQLLEKLMDLADRAGGEAPRPTRPDTTSLDEIRLTAGNEQLLLLYNRREELTRCIETWTKLAERISARWPNWLMLKRLAGHARTIQDADVILAQIKTIEAQRQLLEEPDLIAPLVANLTQLLRNELNEVKTEFDARWLAGDEKLKADANWQELEPEQRHSLRLAQQLVEGAKPKISVENTSAVLETLDRVGLSALRDRLAAMPSRFDQVLLGAAKLLEPKVQSVSLPSRTLKTEADVDAWLTEARDILISRLKDGPVMP